MWKSNRDYLNSHIETFTIFLFSLFCACGFTVAFFPGFMSFDSFHQYRQAIGAVPIVTDAHPLIMAYLWRGLLKIFDHPGVLLAFHQFLYWFAIALFVCVAVRNFRYRLFLFVCIGFCPPLIISSLYLWKDVGMMCCLAIASGALLADIRKPHWGWKLIALITLFYAAAVRHNGFISAFPLLVFLCYRIASHERYLKWRKTYLTSIFVLGLCMVHVITMKIVNLETKKDYGLGSLVVWDMVAISLMENQDLLPDYLPRNVSVGHEFMKELRASFSPSANYPCFAVISHHPPENLQNQLVKDWLSLAYQHPVSYMKHRLRLFAILLGIGTSEVYYPFHPGIEENEFGFRFSTMTDIEAWNRFQFFRKMTSSIIYRPWVYFLLGFATLIISLTRIAKQRKVALEELFSATVAFSGLVTVGSLLVIATAADYRYITWMIFSALFSGAVMGIVLMREMWPGLSQKISGILLDEKFTTAS